MRLNPGQLDLMQYPALIPLLNCFKSLVKPECYFEFHSAKKKTFEIKVHKDNVLGTFNSLQQLYMVFEILMYEILIKFSCIDKYIFLNSELLQLDMKKGGAVTSVITFAKKNVSLPSDSRLSKKEAYEILIDPNSDSIQVHANADAGAFYAVQTLLSIRKKEYDKKANFIGYHFPKIKITDAPRFEYRGLMVDVSRNFVSKTTILKLLDLMAMYKVNKFHFHLTDDDGWRLEIRSFPELTEVCNSKLQTN